ncbi:MAG: hypothetical protein ACOX3Q_01410 [Clostridia bacterium]|jgi:hypothetical protein|nr:hypothetical protein [Clostridiaceae bacterium]
MRNKKNQGSVEFAVIFCALTVFIFLPLFGTLAQKALLYYKKEAIRQSVDLAVMAAYTALDASEAGTGEQILSEDKFRRIFVSVLSRNLKLDHDLTGYPHSMVAGKIEIHDLAFVNSGLPYSEGGRTFTYPFIRCELSVPVEPDLFTFLWDQKTYILRETVYTELPFDR